jgi:hypothetical protein
MVPEELTVNERVLCPPGATMLDHVSLIDDEGLLGVVGVSLPPHPATRTATTNHGDTKLRSRHFFSLCVSVPPWFVSEKDAALMGA